MPTSVLLIRHGDYLHRPSPAGEAASDHGLSPLGRQQAQALHDRLAASPGLRADVLVCSSLPRAHQTAACIAPAWGLTPLALPALCEWDSGNEALGADVFGARFQALPAAQRRHHRFHPGCETLAEFTQRVRTALDALLLRHAGQTLAVVAHGGIVEVAFSHFLGFGPGPFEGGHPAADPCSLTLWRHGQGGHDEWVQVFANDTAHLQHPDGCSRFA
jgi:probable phosphoglycerate mutase